MNQFTRIHEGVANLSKTFELLNRHKDAPFDQVRLSGDLYAGEWWECTEEASDYFLTVLPPIYFPGGFAMCEFTTADVTLCFVQVNRRNFAGYCRVSRNNPLRPEQMRDHIAAAFSNA